MQADVEGFARMRRAFLQAALREAEASGDPSSLVRLERVAEGLGADPHGETGLLLMRRYAEMARYYRETEDLTELCVSGDGGTFRLTARGIGAARDEG